MSSDEHIEAAFDGANEYNVQALSDFRLDKTDFDKCVVIPEPQARLKEPLELAKKAV